MENKASPGFEPLLRFTVLEPADQHEVHRQNIPALKSEGPELGSPFYFAKDIASDDGYELGC